MASDKEAADRAAIQQLIKNWKEAVLAKDVRRVQEMVTEDSVFLVTGAPPTKGKEQVGAMMTRAFARMEMRQDFDLEEILITGDYAIGWGIESAEVTPATGGPTSKFRGYSMTILQRQPDGSWKFARGLNSMKPE